MADDVGFTTMGSVSDPRGEIPSIGIGMLGYAFMGKAHANGYKKLAYMMYPPAANPVLVNIAGRSEGPVADAAKRFGFQRHCTDWRDLIADDDVQVLDNGGPNNLHAEPSIAAVKAGKHVICEKPLGRNPGESRAMLEAAEAAGVKHMCGFNYRFVPAIVQARELIQSGHLGDIFHFRARYCQEWIIDPQFPKVWRLDKAVAGSGALGDLGAHIIDLARFLIGEPRSVNGLLKTFIKERPLEEDSSKTGPVDVDDAFVSIFEFQNGAIGTMEATRFAMGRKNLNTFEINGSKGSISFNLERLNELEVFLADTQTAQASGFRNVLVTEADHPYWEHWWPHGHIIGWEHTFAHELHHFLDCIVNDKDVAPLGATFEDGYKCDVIMDSIAKSSDNGGSRVEISY